MEKLSENELLEKLITKILKDIDRSLVNKKSNYKLILDTFTNKKEILKYLKKEKSSIRKLLNKTNLINKSPLEKYQNYLEQKPLNPNSRKLIISELLYVNLIFNNKTEFVNNFLSLNSYIEQRKHESVKIIIQEISTLEYNLFLTEELNKIIQDDSNLSDSENKKLKWNGNQTELIELVKALIENKSIEGLQKDIIKNFTDLFGFEIKNPDKLIQDIKKRNNGSETLFLDKLKTKLVDFISTSNQR